MATLTPRPAACGSVSACRSYVCMLTYDCLICGENGLGSVRIPMAMLAPKPAACGFVSACRSYGLYANTNANLYTVLCGHVELMAAMLTPTPICIRLCVGM